MDIRVSVLTARFQQYDAGARVFGQPIGQYTAGRARTDDHIISLHDEDLPTVPYSGIAAVTVTSK